MEATPIATKPRRTEWFEELDEPIPTPPSITPAGRPQTIPTGILPQAEKEANGNGTSPEGTLTTESTSTPHDSEQSKPVIPRTPRDFKAQAVEQGSIPVFNRSHGILGFMEQDHPYIEIPAGRWTTTTTSGKPIPKDFVYRYLLNNPDVSVQLPYKPLRGDKTKLTVASPLVSVTGWGICSGYIVSELAKLRLEKGYYSPEAKEMNPPESLYDATKIGSSSTIDAEISDLILFPLANWHYQGMPELTQALMRKPHHSTEWSLVLSIPSELPQVPSPNVIMMSMWETGILPKEWRGLMEQNHVRHLIVPSESQVDLFRQGYDGEISVVPLGVDTNVFSFYERPQRDSDQPFSILLYGLLGARKSPVDVLVEVCYRAFSGAYGQPVDNWRLILKTRAGVLSGLKGISDNHVEIINQDYMPEEMAKLTHQADVAIFLPHYEGYGLPFRESMSCGLPVIVAAHSGHLDDCNPDLNIPIPSDVEVPATEGYHNPTEGWNWLEPSWEEAAKALRKEYNDWVARGRTQSEMGRRASRYIAEKRTWQYTAKGIQSVLEKVILPP